MFSRQHYQKFAEIIKKMSGKDQELLATELITMFRKDNPRFNAEQFAKAAGLEGNTRLHNVIYAHESKVNESFGAMKLTPLLPVGRITELGFHGGNPTPEDVDVLADDFEDMFDQAENALDTALDGIVDAAREAEFKDVESAIRQQVTLFRKAIGVFRANVQKIYLAKQKKLGGR